MGVTFTIIAYTVYLLQQYTYCNNYSEDLKCSTPTVLAPQRPLGLGGANTHGEPPPAIQEFKSLESKVKLGSSCACDRLNLLSIQPKEMTYR